MEEKVNPDARRASRDRAQQRHSLTDGELQTPAFRAPRPILQNTFIKMSCLNIFQNVSEKPERGLYGGPRSGPAPVLRHAAEEAGDHALRKGQPVAVAGRRLICPLQNRLSAAAFSEAEKSGRRC